MRIGFTVAAAILLVAWAASQSAAQTIQPTTSPRLPYIARFKGVTVGPDGKTISTSTRVDAVDSQGRHYVSYSEGSGPTQVQVSDPLSLTMSYWPVPGAKASIVHMPDLGEPETECAKKMKAINPLHPVGAETQPEDLGAKSFLGVAAKGGKISFTRRILRASEGPPPRQTNEAWIATDPGLKGLLVHMVMSTSDGRTTTEQMVEFTPGEPNPKLFQVPEGRDIARREGQAYICDMKPKPMPARAPSAK
jgi:hypothetical protein